MFELTEYGGDIHCGTRNVGVDLGDVEILVKPHHKDSNAEAKAVAERIVSTEIAFATLNVRNAALEALVTRLEAQNAKLEAKVATANAVNRAAIAGRRQFFSAVLMQPVKPDDWAGEVWLLDPVKKGDGFGLRFASVAEVRALHPELWVVETNADGVLLDAWGGV